MEDELLYRNMERISGVGFLEESLGCSSCGEASQLLGEEGKFLK